MPVRVVEESFTDTGLPRLKIQREHWAHRLLAVKPNDWQTSYEFREGMIFNAALGKGAVAIKNVVNSKVRRAVAGACRIMVGRTEG
jgi:phage portal protein BeeE